MRRGFGFRFARGPRWQSYQLLGGRLNVSSTTIPNNAPSTAPKGAIRGWPRTGTPRRTYHMRIVTKVPVLGTGTFKGTC